MQPDERNANTLVTIEVTPAEAEMITDLHLLGYSTLYEALYTVLYSSMIDFQPEDADDPGPTAQTYNHWRDILSLMRLFAVAGTEHARQAALRRPLAA